MSKYKKEIKHCEKCNKPFQCSRTAQKLFAQVAKGTIWRKRFAETVMHRSICLSGDLMTESRKRLLSKMPQEELPMTGTRAFRKFAVIAESLLKSPVQNAFFFESHNMALPKRCPACRKARKRSEEGK